MEIFKLVGSIFVDTDKANESIKKTDEKAGGLGKTFLKGVETAAKWGAGIVAGASAAATAVGGLVVKTSENADAIDKMSQKIGISTDEYQKWKYAMELAGADVNILQTGMKTLTSAMADASAGNATAAAKFEALGVSIYDANGELKSQEDMLNEVIGTLADMDDGAERSALAVDLLGKSATELAPLLNGGSAAIDEAKQAAEELGLVMSETAVKDGAAMNDSITTIKESFTAMANNLGSSVMPIVQELLDFVIANLPTVQALFGKLEPVVMLLLESALPPLMQITETLLPPLVDLIDAIMPIATEIYNTLMPAFIQLTQMLLPPIIQIVQKLLPPLLELLKPILNLLSPILALLQPAIDLLVALTDPISKLITKYLTPLVNTISSLISSALTPLKSALTTVASVIQNTVSVFSGFESKVANIKNAFSGILTFIKGTFTSGWKSAWSGIESIFSNVFNGMKQAFKTPINWIIDGINSFIRGINKIKIPDWVPAVGGKGFSIKELPKLAQGGVLERGQVGLLEGDGAEAVVPLDQNKAWIAAVSKDMQKAGVNSMSDQMAAAMLDVMDRILDRLEGMEFKAEIVADTDRMFKAYTRSTKEAYQLGRA